MLIIFKMENNIITPWVLMRDDYFVEYSPLPKNYNLSEIRPYYKISDDLWIKPILGLPLFEELLEQVNTNTLRPENSTLYLMLLPFLAFAITQEALPFIAYHFSETGITKGFSDNSTSVSINDVNFINTRLRSSLETLKVGFKKWLDDHSDSYPLYKPNNCDCVQSSGCDNDYWLLEYFNGGYRNSNWLWQYFNNKNKPQTRLQCFSTPRKPIDLM